MPRQSAHQSPLRLTDIAETQDMVVSGMQLASAGYDADASRRRVNSGEWQKIGHAFVLHSGVPSGDQLAWAAVLTAPGLVALTSRSASKRYGLRGFAPAAVDIWSRVAMGRRNESRASTGICRGDSPSATSRPASDFRWCRGAGRSSMLRCGPPSHELRAHSWWPRFSRESYRRSR